MRNRYQSSFTFSPADLAKLTTSIEATLAERNAKDKSKKHTCVFFAELGPGLKKRGISAEDAIAGLKAARLLGFARTKNGGRAIVFPKPGTANTGISW